MKFTIIALIILILTTVSFASADDAPAMWMEQNGNRINLMVNTSEDSSGANAWVYFDSNHINITTVDFTGSPWQPLTEPGWSHQGDHIILTLVKFEGVPAGQYKIAELGVHCLILNGTTEIIIEKAEPVGVQVHNLTFKCTDIKETPAIISISDGIGTTTIPIKISNADNVGSVDVTLTYDPGVTRVVGIHNGNMDCTYTNLEHVDEGWIRVGAIQGDNLGLSGNFTLLNVDFEPVGSNVECELVISVTTFKDCTPDCNPLVYTVVNGTYRSILHGDANSDGIVDIADASYIAKHVIGIAGYEEIDKRAADVNGDNSVDMSDSMYLTKHVIGLSGYEQLR